MCVDDGARVLTALLDARFDVVLMDCQMPRMDGYEATREIRRRERMLGGHQHIIALTANASAEDREACRRAGMDAFLAKPFQRRELLASLAGVPPAAPPVDLEALDDPDIDGERVTGRVVTVRDAPAPRRASATLDAVTERIPVIDRIALDRLRAAQAPGATDLIPRVLHLFLDCSPGQVQAIQGALAAAHADGLASAAHELKGSSGSLGMVQLAMLLENVEKLARAGRLADAAPRVARLDMAHAAATVAARNELAHVIVQG